MHTINNGGCLMFFINMYSYMLFAKPYHNKPCFGWIWRYCTYNNNNVLAIAKNLKTTFQNWLIKFSIIYFTEKLIQNQKCFGPSYW